MLSCTFFGHRDCPDTVRRELKRVLEELIVEQGVQMFYVGDKGQFDAIVHGVLRELAQQYPAIDYAVVIAYLPQGQTLENDTMFPEGLETVPRRFAIERRNLWMLAHADYVITYVTHDWGGAAKFARKARRCGKIVIELAQKQPVKGSSKNA